MKRLEALDYMKTIAILAVVFFHMSTLSNGYLGVDIFFVISGYLFFIQSKQKLEDRSFHPIEYISKRLFAFWPLVVVAGLVSLGLGLIGMLPDDYENLADSVVASNFFMNNVLQVLTTRNYWDIVNTYKPLMHTWYIGVLMQSMVFLSVLLWIVSKPKNRDWISKTVIFLFFVSLLLFLIPFIPSYYKFYLFPFRLFELLAGCIVVYLPIPKKNAHLIRVVGKTCFCLLALILFSNISIPNDYSILLVVSLSSIAIWTYSSVNEDFGINNRLYKIITLPGRHSYDVYIWHQVAIAFLLYYVFQKPNTVFVLAVIAFTSVLSTVSGVLRMKTKSIKMTKIRLIILIISFITSTGIAFNIYLHAGVVRDIPELGISMDNVYRNMHAKYVDIPYSWDTDFRSDKKHVLVMGDSFGRDFANILNESEFCNQIEISYRSGANTSEIGERIDDAEIVFYASSGWGIPETINSLPMNKLFIVGNKTFGNSNGIIYINRNKPWYFDQTVELEDSFIKSNNYYKEIYQDRYVDMVSPLIVNGNNIKVFSDNGYYISQDCRHLTKNGAIFYSKVLDLRTLLGL